MRFLYFLLIASIVITGTSCKTGKKLKAAEAQYKTLSDQYVALERKLIDCETAVSDADKRKKVYDKEIEDLNRQITFLKENNTAVLGQLKDLSVITNSQAESIKKSLDNIGAKDSYIQTIQQATARKDSLNLSLVMNLKGVLGNLNDNDVEIKVDKGIVMISLSDKMLYKSGSYEISESAGTVLAKVAQVLNSQPDLDILIEGHTDNVPISKPGIKDNWDLSALRATSVARALQTRYGIDPKRITAGGKSEYSPLTTNDTAENRSINRRTRIIIMPQLDQFFKLLERKI
ncbi:MAG: OmpA family protein [Saprospiraceae bacterium]|mgnify:FL=1|jgi:chemotaxis protein MotB|nr:OmpA family protein [Saprospiraceae bacterium]MCA0334790.1 OmpA family protein [Bacteroidota bacterium]MCO5279074.1 OmpA family protein [Saprospiraceae bacterium]HMT78368.1 OmpA family protein [Saprospiraceae bacterium]HQU96975.1 OmpA family protein [Saprospiraceae bacterium]